MKLVCVGDCGIDDYIGELERPGGCTLNFAANARQLLPPADTVEVVSAVGDDEAGSIVLNEIARLGLVPHVTTIYGQTPRAPILRRPGAESEMPPYQPGVQHAWRLLPSDFDVLRSADVVMTVVYDHIEHVFRQLMAVRLPGLVAVDFMNLGDFGRSPSFVEEFIDSFDIGFFGLKPNDQVLIANLRDLAFRSGKLFVVTLSEHGSVAFHEGTTYEAPGVEVPPEQVMDTVGAGDSFAAGFLCRYAMTHDIQRALRAGNEQGAGAVRMVGAF